MNDYAKQHDLSIISNKNKYSNLVKIHKQLIQRKKRQYQQLNRENMENLLGRNQADCWKHWNKLKRLGITNRIDQT